MKDEERERRREQVRELHQKDMTRAEIARRLGIHQDTVLRDLRAMGLVPPPHQKPKGRVPREVVASVLERGILEFGSQDSFARACVVAPRLLYAIRTGNWASNAAGHQARARSVSFDVADKIVTAIDPGLWHVELAEWVEDL